MRLLHTCTGAPPTSSGCSMPQCTVIKWTPVGSAKMLSPKPFKIWEHYTCWMPLASSALHARKSWSWSAVGSCNILLQQSLVRGAVSREAFVLAQIAALSYCGNRRSFFLAKHQKSSKMSQILGYGKHILNRVIWTRKHH